MNVEQIREMEQLWFVGSSYLSLADFLANEKRSYGKVWEAFKDNPEDEQTLRTVLLSAHLDSAAGRFASLEELLVGGDRALRALAYPKGKDGAFSGSFNSRYMHVYLRDSVSHSEPQGDPGERPEWKKRQQWLEREGIDASYRAMQNVRKLLGDEIQLRHAAITRLGTWTKMKADEWVMKITKA